MRKCPENILYVTLTIPSLLPLFLAYTNIYVLMPGESKQVEAATDPIGLKIGIVYDAAPEGQILMYQMWKVKNESVLTITYVNGGDISTFGGKFSTVKLTVIIH